MERGKYRFELGQIIKGENGEYVITKREKRKDYTKKAIQRKRYTLVCPNKHEFEMEECHIEYRTPKCPLCYHPKIIMADPNFAVMFVNKEYPYNIPVCRIRKRIFIVLTVEKFVEINLSIRFIRENMFRANRAEMEGVMEKGCLRQFLTV